MTGGPTTRAWKMMAASMLMMAGLLSFLSCGTDSVEKTLLVPIEPVNLPEGRVCANCPLKDLEVTVQGPGKGVATFTAAAVTYPLDCTDAKTGTNSITIDPNRFSVPEGVVIRSIVPDFVALHLQKQLTRQLPVQIHIEGTVPAGYTIAEAAATPDKVVVKGPSSAVASLDRVSTKSVSVQNLQESFTKSIPLELPEKVSAVSPAEGVAVEITIAQKIVTREYREVPVTLSDPRVSAAISPESVTIRLRGPEKALDRLERENRLQVMVDIEDPGTGIYPRPARIALPQKVLLMAADAEIFTVTVQ